MAVNAGGRSDACGRLQHGMMHEFIMHSSNPEQQEPSLPAGGALLPATKPRQLQQGTVRIGSTGACAAPAVCCLHGQWGPTNFRLLLKAVCAQEMPRWWAPWRTMSRYALLGAIPCHPMPCCHAMSCQVMPHAASFIHSPDGWRKSLLGAMPCGTKRTRGCRRRGSAAAGLAGRAPLPSAGSRRARGSLQHPDGAGRQVC